MISSSRKSREYQPKNLLPEAKLLLTRRIVDEEETQNVEQHCESYNDSENVNDCEA